MKLIHVFENEVPNITDPYKAYLYANKQGKRIPELEPLILKHPVWARWYAKLVIKGRWPEAEPIIMKVPQIADDYLRWCPEARTPSKDVPLVLGKYAIIDVPNTITDEQVMKLLKILEPLFSTTKEIVVTYRVYVEPQIKERIASGELRQTTTKKLMNNKRVRTAFLNSIDWYTTTGDFE